MSSLAIDFGDLLKEISRPEIQNVRRYVTIQGKRYTFEEAQALEGFNHQTNTFEHPEKDFKELDKVLDKLMADWLSATNPISRQIAIIKYDLEIENYILDSEVREEQEIQKLSKLLKELETLEELCKS